MATGPCGIWVAVRRVPVFEFAIRSELAKVNLDTNAKVSSPRWDAAARIIARIKDRGLINRYAVSLDKWLGMLDEEFVRTRVLQQATRQSGSRQSGSRQSGSRHPGAMAGPNGPGEPARRQQQGEGPGQNGRPGEVRGDTGPGEQARYDLGDPVIQVEREALKLAVQRPALCGPAFDVLGPAAFTVEPHAAVRELIDGCGGTRGAASVAGIG